MGTLRYCGPAEFAAGIWAGIELDEAGGKNDGSIGGISYFQCPKNHGKTNDIVINESLSRTWVMIENCLIGFFKNERKQQKWMRIASWYTCTDNACWIFLGIFAPISKIAKPGSAPRPRSPAVSPHKSPVQRAGSVDVSNVKARVDTGNISVQIQ